MKILHVFLFFVLVGLLACQSENNSENQTENKVQDSEIQQGTWRAILKSQGGDLPFGLEISQKDNSYLMYLLNGEERLVLDEIRIEGDSIFVPMHIFDAQIVAHISPKKLRGYFQKLDTEEEYKIDFLAEFGKNYRFENQNIEPVSNISGKWKTTFQVENREIPAIGQFDQKGSKLTGTFMTKTGDYRYLEGSIFGDSLMLSCFDGSHSYLFKAKIEGDKIVNGEFWSGKTGYRQWVAERDENFTLEDPEKITFLKEGFESIDFKFPSLTEANKLISLKDEKFKNKVVLVQILGTWCPNCMDETAFLADWYQQNKREDLAMIGMAFELKDDWNYAEKRITKFRKRFQADYDFVFAGTPSKENRQKALPMLNKIAAFPTTIFIDKSGKVRKIHTGFSGPGTGEYYTQFKAEFEETMQKLLAE